MDSIDAGLLQAREPPLLSLYQPTFRRHPENAQDLIRFGNLVSALERGLRDGYPSADAQSLLAPFHALADDRDFWNATGDGIGVLAASGFFRVYRLDRPVYEYASVADSFHIKPLVRIVQSADRFQILALEMQRVALYEGNRDALTEIELAGEVPSSLTAALGEQVTEPHQNVVGGPGIHHGYGDKKDEAEIDAERFFRAVDRAVLEHHSRPAQLPLLLAALPDHQALFRRVSHNPQLLGEGLEINPGALGLDELRRRAWEVVSLGYEARLAALTERFETARAQDKGTADLATAARAATAAQIDTLLIEADRRVPGRIDPTTGAVEARREGQPGVDDTLDDLGEAVLRAGGEVIVVPAEQMPTDSGLAAIFRYGAAA